MDRRENAVFRYKTTGKQNEGGGEEECYAQFIMYSLD